MTATESGRAVSDEEAVQAMRYTAWKYAKKYGRGWQLVGDLFQEGMLGAMEAAKTFDPSLGLKFASYATRRVIGRILDYLRDQSFAPRLEVQKAKADGRELKRVVSMETVGVLGGGSKRADKGGTFDRGKLRYDPPHHDPEPTDGTAKEFRAFVRRLGVGLTAAERDILKWYYVDGLSMKRVGELLGVGETRISQMHSDILGRLSQAEAGRIAEAWAGVGR